MPTGEDQRLDEIRQALAHLDDPPYLENLRLASRLDPAASGDGLSRGQALRRALLLAIAALDPGTGTGGGAMGARAYQVLYRYAVSRQSTVAIAMQLGVSRRHVYRELQQGAEALASVLEQMLAPPPPAEEGSPLAEELTRLSTQHELFDLRELVASCVRDAELLARERGGALVLGPTAQGHWETLGNRVMLRQAVLNLLSDAVRQSARGVVSLLLVRDTAWVQLVLSYRSSTAAAERLEQSPYQVALSLLEAMSLRWSQRQTADGWAELVVEVPLVLPATVLVVDDNPGMIQLVRRYLEPYPYTVLAAHGVDEALVCLQTEPVEIMLLDVMMPRRDGWELLRTLRQQPVTQQVRVIICSIIDDPQMARALGADGFLRKPIDEQRLVQALEAALVGR